MIKIVLAHIINPLSDKQCSYVIDGALVVENEIIMDLGERKKILKKYNKGEVQVIDLKGHFIIPSFFDMHFHWVQDDVREMPKADLLTWLNKYTFPAEKKFENKEYSIKKAKKFFKKLTKSGTLGGAIYSSIHEHALLSAFDFALGDFIIGNVLMTINSPKYLTQSPEDAIKMVKKNASKFKNRYALTPRFALATDPMTMKKSSKVIEAFDSFKQSHLSETKQEINAVLDLYKNYEGFQDINNYTELYHKVGMLGEKSIMGHGIHLGVDELKLLSKTGTSIAHCPTSNASIRQRGLGSGLFDFRKIEKHKIKWALASDIGGGPFLSMFDVMRSFVAQNHKEKVYEATYVKALYHATLAGAEMLKLKSTHGNLVKGKFANFLVLPKIQKPESLTPEMVLKRYIDKMRNQRGNYDALVKMVFYKGQMVFSQ